MRKPAQCLLLLFVVTLSFFSFINLTKAQGQPSVFLDPAQIPVTQANQIFTVNITVSNIQSLWAWNLNVTWDPTYLKMVNAPTEGPFLTQTGNTLFFPGSPDNTVGTIPGNVSDTLFVNNGASGNGVLATLQFQVISSQLTSTMVQINGITLEGPLPASEVSENFPHPQITPASTTASATVSFTQGGAPAANAGPNQIVKAGATVTFNGTNSLSSGTSPTYTWSFYRCHPKDPHRNNSNVQFQNSRNLQRHTDASRLKRQQHILSYYNRSK